MHTLKLLLMLLVLSWRPAQAQLLGEFEAAIIKDADGYTNVREEGSKQAPIIRRIVANEPFWFSPEDYTSNKEWIGVEVATSKFSEEIGVAGYAQQPGTASVQPAGLQGLSIYVQADHRTIQPRSSPHLLFRARRWRPLGRKD